MTQKTDFEIFLCISKNKYQISVYDTDNLKNLYNAEIKTNDEIELDNLSNFLDENINFVLNLAIEFLNDNKFIDARIENQIILDD